MLKILLSAIAATLLSVILLLGNIQNRREAAANPYLKQVIKSIADNDADSSLRYLHPEYQTAPNKNANLAMLSELKQKLSGLGPVLNYSDSIFSYRSGTHPFKTRRQSDVYIVRVQYRDGDVLYRIGVVTADAGKAADIDIPYVDRLYVTSEILHNGSGREQRYTLIVQCSNEKKIIKNCSKPKPV